MPTILCLINSAPYSRAYFEKLAPYLADRGYKVVFALDSHLSDILYANNIALPNAWYFTDFLKKNLEDLKNVEIDEAHSWSSLFSDFDRFLTFVPFMPVCDPNEVKYRHIPGMLNKFFEGIFTQVAPIAVLYETVSNSFAIAAYNCATKHDIPFCSLTPSRIPGRIELSMTGALEDDVTIGNIYKNRNDGTITDISRKIAVEYCQKIDQSTPDYMKTNGLDQISIFKKYFNADKLKHFYKGWKYSRLYSDDCELAYQHGNPLKLSFAFLRRAINRKLRLSRVLKQYSVDVMDEKFVLYPLHFHPEASSSIWASDYVDELNTVKAIAFRLPASVKLYVKEHPSAVALQPLSFYKQLNSLPNVKLLAPQLPTKEIIRRSAGVVTLTSTVGFEAAVLNKPVITLGNVFYNFFPNVNSVRDYSQLAPAIEWLLKFKPISENDLIDATAAYIEFGMPGAFDFHRSLNDSSALSRVADIVAEKLQFSKLFEYATQTRP